jgi:flagellar protein FliL
MAKDQQTKEQTETAPPEAVAKKLSITKKLIIFGVIIFVVQFIAIYFLTAKLIIPMTQPNGTETAPPSNETIPPPEPEVFLIKDIIINPAGTNGTRFLMTTIGLEVNGPEGMKEVEKKEVEARDVLNSILTSKGLEELADVQRRENLRDEITQKLSGLVKENTLRHIYFSKFIIQ